MVQCRHKCGSCPSIPGLLKFCRTGQVSDGRANVSWMTARGRSQSTAVLRVEDLATCVAHVWGQRGCTQDV